MPAEPDIQCFNTLDSRFTTGLLPFVLRAALCAFKIAPGDFVAGMTLDLSTEATGAQSHKPVVFLRFQQLLTQTG